MITVEKAETLIQERLPQFHVQERDVQKCVGHILRENVISERDQPPFDRVCMDGIALKHSEWKKGRQSFVISNMQKAGEARKALSDSTQCLEVATGAITPEGTDCVVRYEDLTISQENGQNVARLNEGLELRAKQNIHHQGQDYREGDTLLQEGVRIHGPHIAVLASNGYKKVKVSRPPSIAIISTGDELVEIEETPLEHQIHKSNPYALEAELHSFGLHETTLFHLPDKQNEMREKVKEIMQNYSVLILSGGVSMGKFDFLPQVFQELNIEEVFHKVSLRPGKPFWFGTTPEKKLVFSLPGNPVSCVIGVRRFVIPALFRGLGANPDKAPVKTSSAKLTEDVHFKKELTYFIPVTVSCENSELKATPVPTHGSGDYTGLGRSDGFLELPKDMATFSAGESFPLYLWGNAS